MSLNKRGLSFLPLLATAIYIGLLTLPLRTIEAKGEQPFHQTALTPTYRLIADSLVSEARVTKGSDSLVAKNSKSSPSSFGASLFLPQFSGSSFKMSTTVGERIVRVMGTTMSAGQSGTVNIEFDSQGDENALGFSINFDQTKLTFVSAVKGTDANSAGASTNVNSAGATNGRVGIALALSAGASFSAGTRQLMVLTFNVSPGGSSSTNVTFGDVPIGREVVSPVPVELPATYAPGTVIINSPTAADSTITGRVTNSGNARSEGIVVNLAGSQNRKTITDANGSYRFDNVETNGFYTITPARASYLFSPTSRSFDQLDSSTEASFTATPGDGVNPLDTPEYFVRQQYVDLLGREPDEGGFNYWSDRILECGSDALCVNSRRRDVAAAFFIEQEFQRTGSFIYGLYKGSLSRRPGYAEFSADRQHVVEGPTLEATKQAFAESFVSRAEFASKYQGNNSAESFVDALLVTVSQSSGIDLSNQRANLVSRYNAGSTLIHGRSFVLRDVIDTAGFRAAEYNRAFVLAEYFGYLQRDPDEGGYAFWLDVVSNRDVGNYHSMVCAFISSPEYQRRFSSIVSRSDQECG